MSHTAVGDRAAIAGPGDQPSAVVHARVVAQIDRMAAVSLHYIDLGVAVTRRDEGDTLAVRRPGRAVVDELGGVGGSRWVGEAPLAAAVGVHDIDLCLASTRRDEGNVLAAWRPRRLKVIRPTGTRQSRGPTAAVGARHVE